MLTIWGRRSAFNVQKVMWLIGELGIEYRHVPAGGADGLLDTPDFLAMNPHGRVPVIDDDGVVVWESHSILRFLAARHGRPAFWSEDAGRRSLAERWMDWAQTSLQPAFLNGVFRAGFRTREALRDVAGVEASVARCAGYFQLLDRVLADRPFLVGETLGLADICVGTHLYRYFELEIARPALPRVEAWYDRLRERPAYRDHVMIPFEAMRGQLDG